MSGQDNWVVGNSLFSHAPWVLICLSGSHYRVASRHLCKPELAASWALLTEAAAVESALQRRYYRGCFDLYGHFGDVGSYGSLKDLSEDGCRLLKLGFPVPFDLEPEVVLVEPEVLVVHPEVVASHRLSPLFSSRSH